MKNSTGRVAQFDPIAEIERSDAGMQDPISRAQIIEAPRRKDGDMRCASHAVPLRSA